MKVIKHGNFYKENRTVKCICGCEFEYDTDDIESEYEIIYTTLPRQLTRYVLCPECGARTDIGKTYKYSELENTTYQPHEYFGEE